MDYQGQVKIRVHGVPQYVWVDVKAPSVATARAMLTAQYGKSNVNTVASKPKR